MKILYGTLVNSVDVTQICLDVLNNGGLVTIPAGDHARAAHFGDHIPGVLKSIFIIIDNTITKYDDKKTIRVQLQ